jgi:type III pantothenate kinase
MILAADIGNSNLKCAVVDGHGILGRESLPLERCADATVVLDMVRRVSGSVLTLDAAVICSVVPALDAAVITAIQRQLGVEPVVIDHTFRFPFEIRVPVPPQVGSDRLCAAAGAMGNRRKNGVVIDAGSAITVDLVRDGRFEGGVIAAGPSIALRALNRHASKLPAVTYADLDAPFSSAFDNTELSMRLGAGLGAVGVIRESVRFLESSAGRKPDKFLTGGFAGSLRARLPKSWFFDPDLVLKGIYAVARLNLPDAAG